MPFCHQVRDVADTKSKPTLRTYRTVFSWPLLHEAKCWWL